MKTYILWDWNGTLIDDVDAAVNALNRMLLDRGLAPVTRAFYRDHFGFPVRPFYELVGMDPARDWDRICIDFHRYIAAESNQCLRADARTALEHARACGARQAILSALRQDLLRRDTAHALVQEFFTHIYGVDNLDGASKLTRARELRDELEGAGALADTRLVFIGDTLHDAEVASAIGAASILVDVGHQTGERLRAAGCPVCSDLVSAVDAALGRA